MGCKNKKHDWEVVEVDPRVFEMKDGSCPTHGHSFIYSYYPENKVCVKCGECDYELDRYRQGKRQEKEEARCREAMAKKMWEEGCRE